MNELKELKEEALKAYTSMRGYSSERDVGPQYLANAIKAVTDQATIANNLAKYKHPTLSAIAVKDLGSENADRQPLNTAQAIEVLKRDPFSPKELKEMPTERIIDAMKSTISAPALPIGKSDAKPD